MKIECPKFQVNGLFEIKAERLDECLKILQNSSELGLKAISIQIFEVKLFLKDQPCPRP